jgi:hypothetical protein
MINTFHSPTVSIISEVTQFVSLYDNNIYFLGFYCLNTKLLLKRENNRQAATFGTLRFSKTVLIFHICQSSQADWQGL